LIKISSSFLTVFILLSCFLASCSSENKNLAVTITKLLHNDEPGADSGGRIKELESAIAKYRKTAEQKVEADEKLGTYYNMLAVKYLERKMYLLALENLNEAIKYYPESSGNFYWAAVSAAHYAKAMADAEQKAYYFRLAENHYIRAIELKPGYSAAVYGLAVLYVFELNRTAEARQLLEELAQKETQDTDIMFLLARTYAEGGMITEAVAVYKRIISISNSDERRKAAAANIDALLGGLYD
jgi:tetratricopeptide (TPR) repeat protein